MSGSTMAPDVRLEEVVKEFGDTRAVDGISLEIPRGSFFALLGPSGCGKTTTLRMIGGFEEPTSGRDLPRRPRRRRPAAVQAGRQHRVPELRALPAHDGRRQRRVRARAARASRRRRSRRACARCSSSSTSPAARAASRSQLSGGQQQRVALARALVNNPRVLLLDEPLGALDLKLRKQMQLELKRIQNEVGITFVHVTHDQEEAMTMADTIAVMNGGRIEQLGTPDRALRAPAHGVRRRLPRQVEPARRATSTGDGVVRLVDGTELCASDERRARARSSIGVRPEKIRLGDGRRQPALRARCEESRTSASRPQVVVATPVGEMYRLPPERRDRRLVPAPGEPGHRCRGRPRRRSSSIEERSRSNDHADHPAGARPARCGRRHDPVPAGTARRVRRRRAAAAVAARSRTCSSSRTGRSTSTSTRRRRSTRRSTSSPQKTGIKVDYFEDINDNATYFAKIQGPLVAGPWDRPRHHRLHGQLALPRLLVIDKGWVEELDKEHDPEHLEPDRRAEEPTVRPRPDVQRFRGSPGMTGIAWNEDVTGPVTSIDAAARRPEAQGQGDDADRDGRLDGPRDARQRRRPLERHGRDVRHARSAAIQKAVDSGQIRRFTGNDYAQPLTKGDLAAAVAWSGDVVQLLAVEPEAQVGDPEEGRR